jgi:hypothetical protein
MKPSVPEQLQDGPREIVEAIHTSLVEHGYPVDGVADWWTDFAYTELGHRTPLEAWMAGEYRAVWSMVEAGYSASEMSARDTANDPEQMAELRATVAELNRMYA